METALCIFIQFSLLPPAGGNKRNAAGLPAAEGTILTLKREDVRVTSVLGSAQHGLITGEQDGRTFSV